MCKSIRSLGSERRLFDTLFLEPSCAPFLGWPALIKAVPALEYVRVLTIHMKGRSFKSKWPDGSLRELFSSPMGQETLRSLTILGDTTKSLKFWTALKNAKFLALLERFQMHKLDPSLVDPLFSKMKSLREVMVPENLSSVSVSKALADARGGAPNGIEMLHSSSSFEWDAACRDWKNMTHLVVGHFSPTGSSFQWTLTAPFLRRLELFLAYHNREGLEHLIHCLTPAIVPRLEHLVLRTSYMVDGTDDDFPIRLSALPVLSQLRILCVTVNVPGGSNFQSFEGILNPDLQVCVGLRKDRYGLKDDKFAREPLLTKMAEAFPNAQIFITEESDSCYVTQAPSRWSW